MRRSRQPQVTQHQILQATREELTQAGPTFSLDAVAKRAGVSKGGVLHHFPTREALIKALILDTEKRFLTQVHAIQAATPAEDAQRGAWLRAYIQASFQENSHETALIMGMISLLQHLDDFSEFQEAESEFARRAAADGLSPARVSAVQLACDGYWLGQMLPATRMSPAEAQALKEELMSWTR